MRQPLSMQPNGRATTSSMVAHPNRAWRRQMHEQAALFIDRHQPPPDAVAGIITREQLRRIMLDSYIEGFECGRLSVPRREAR